MAVNYEDKRFQNVEKQEKNELNQINKTYDSMINNSQKYYNDMIKASNDYAKQQKKIQQANTDFAIEKINQQKDWAEKDYTREQKGAYTDWRKQSNEYGAEAEEMASRGLTNTGYSESSQVSMYNTYQNRVATARDSYNRAVQDYDNQITQARLANNSALADIAYKALQTKLQLSLEGFQYKNTLMQTKLSAQQTTKDRYYSRWQDVLKQINTENALAEEKRQFDAQMQANRSYSYSYGGGGGSYSGATIQNNNAEVKNNSGGGKESAKKSNKSGGSSWATNATNWVNNMKNALKKSSSNTSSAKTYKSNYSPNLTTSGRNWYVKSPLNTSKPVSETVIINTLTKAYNSKQITQGDLQNILKAYGLS